MVVVLVGCLVVFRFFGRRGGLRIRRHVVAGVVHAFMHRMIHFFRFGRLGLPVHRMVHATVRRMIHRRRFLRAQDVFERRRACLDAGVTGKAPADHASQFDAGEPVVAHGFQVGLVSVVFGHLRLDQLEHADQHEVLALLLAGHDRFTLRHQRLAVDIHHLAQGGHGLRTRAHAVVGGQFGLLHARQRFHQPGLGAGQLRLALVEDWQLQ